MKTNTTTTSTQHKTCHLVYDTVINRTVGVLEGVVGNPLNLSRNHYDDISHGMISEAQEKGHRLRVFKCPNGSYEKALAVFKEGGELDLICYTQKLLGGPLEPFLDPEFMRTFKDTQKQEKEEKIALSGRKYATRKISELTKQKIERLRSLGWTLRNIAKELGVSVGCTHSVLNDSRPALES